LYEALFHHAESDERKSCGIAREGGGGGVEKRCGRVREGEPARLVGVEREVPAGATGATTVVAVVAVIVARLLRLLLLPGKNERTPRDIAWIDSMVELLHAERETVLLLLLCKYVKGKRCTDRKGKRNDKRRRSHSGIGQVSPA
jgi:hypothetical protein